jgi:hypothetical protein
MAQGVVYYILRLCSVVIDMSYCVVCVVAGGVGSTFNLPQRIKFIGTYKFILVTEYAIEEDWVSPIWSQAFLAGVIPVRTLHGHLSGHVLSLNLTRVSDYY